MNCSIINFVIILYFIYCEIKCVRFSVHCLQHLNVEFAQPNDPNYKQGLLSNW